MFLIRSSVCHLSLLYRFITLGPLLHMTPYNVFLFTVEIIYLKAICLTSSLYAHETPDHICLVCLVISIFLI